MSLYNVKKIQIASVLKVLPVFFAILGVLIGLVMFFLFPTDLTANLGFGVKLLSWVIFVVLQTVIMAIGSLIVVWLYNFVVSTLNSSVVISLEPKDK
ncbi:MAG: hypothetical protein LBB06_01615 [Endomicrobium sp.]|jgi:hypothetical protein|nr:hypothetical protein [Endomicrobium sp.]